MKYFDTRDNIRFFIERCHKTAVEKGFWDKDTKANIPRLLMLIVSELGEAYDATTPENFNEELADVYIRICDMFGGLSITPSIIYEDKELNYPIDCDEPEGINLMAIVSYLGKALEAHRKDEIDQFEVKLNYALSALFMMCEAYDINLDEAVTKKMAYNLSRPHKHGKKY